MTRIRTIIFVFLTLCGIFSSAHTLHAKRPNFHENLQQRTIMTGQASWYSEQDAGIRQTTANMEIFDDTQMTAAMWNVPFQQRIKVTNLENGQSVIVRINDRGPHRRFVQQGRIIDLSKSAFAKIASLKEGLIDIRLEFL